MASHEIKLKNVALMEASRGYDVTIVCTSDDHQAKYWQDRLDAAKGTVVPAKSVVLAVSEDWPGGAGNFLGTLYAWRKACAKHREVNGKDLAQELQAGASMALFHTAGKGTRLAPLPGAENNNKPGVKLPAPGLPSILESVIRQTGAYAASRTGRLSVFWGDQVFVPSVEVTYTPRHHVDIVCALGPMPSAQEWVDRGLEKYGLIAARSDNSVVLMLEKVSHAEATARLSEVEGVSLVGPSLGSFSLSAAFLLALESGFSQELDARVGKMDTDPHVWMAMTLGPEPYAALMKSKSLFEPDAALKHHERVTGLATAFAASSGAGLGMFGAVTVGTDFSWWDYGLLTLYTKNSLLLTEGGADPALARAFFNVGETARIDAAQLGTCEVDATSVVSSSRVASGRIERSAVAGVVTGELRASGAVLVNVVAKRVVAGAGAVAYNVVDTSDEGLVLAEHEVRVGVFTLEDTGPYFEMRSLGSIDGGKVFKDKVCGNAFSFQEVYDLNHGVDVSACALAAAKAFQTRAQELQGGAA